MTSLITNTAAISAASNLRSINSNLEKTQQQVSGGLRVGKSADNAAYWSIATTMRSDTSTLSTAEDALNLGAAMVDSTSNGIENALDVMDMIKSRLVAAREPGVDRNKVNTEIEELRNELITITDGSSFNGENWLKHESYSQPWTKPPIQIVGGVSRNGGGFQVNTLDFARQSSDVADTKVINALIDDSSETHGEFGILTSDAYADKLGYSSGYIMVQGSGTLSTPNGPPDLPQVLISVSDTTTDTQVDEMISVVDAMIGSMTTTAANLGAANARIENQSAFIADLHDANTRGIGRLVDADISQESARLRALQTQQQLGTQSLTIANSKPGAMMTLFQ